MSEEVKLLPCPFCGKPAALSESTGGKDHRVHWKASCPSTIRGYVSTCVGASLNTWDATPEDAAAKWNTRPTPPAADSVAVPREPTEAMLNAAIDAHGIRLGEIHALGFRISPQKMFAISYAAMLAAAPQQAGGWRTMESAPRDGTEIVGFRADQGVFLFRWTDSDELAEKDLNGDPVGAPDDFYECWFHDRWGWMEGELTPTHWQPLPLPPSGVA